MKKSIITIVAFMLFALAGFAQGGERVYIRHFTLNGEVGKTTVAIYEKGQTKTIILENAYTKKEESLKSFADILENYLSKGYEIKSSIQTGMYSNEYILQKD